MRRWALVALAVAACGCGTDELVRESTDPHAPRTEDERLLAGRYREFVRALEREEPAGLCRQLDARLTRAYRCATPARLRIPRSLRRAGVTLDEVFAVMDPLAGGEVQISSRARRGGSLIVFYRRSDGDWRVSRAFVGGYG